MKSLMITGMICFSISQTAALAEVVKPVEKPNIVVIDIDDWRYDFYGEAGHPYLETPTIDKLAQEGVTFDRSYCTVPLSTPSRTALLTGMYPQQNKQYNHFHMPPGSQKLSNYPHYNKLYTKYLKENGYQSGYFGKWHIGWDLMTKENLSPNFDTVFTWSGVYQEPGQSLKDARNQYFHRKMYFRYMLDENGKSGSRYLAENYATDEFFIEASSYIEKLDGDKPFYVHLAPLSAHAPFNPDEKYAGKYESFVEPFNLGRTDYGSLMKNRGKHYTPKRLLEFTRNQAEMMLSVDDGIARILKVLNKKGFSDNTIVILTGDNGMVYGEHGDIWKKLPWEESVRVPLIVWSAGQLVAGDGRIVASPVSRVDFMPTILDIAGIATPSHADGQSFANLIKNNINNDDGNRFALNFGYGEKEVTNDGIPNWVTITLANDWKLMAYPGSGTLSMYNLTEDPYEQNDLYGRAGFEQQQTELVYEMKKQLDLAKVPTAWLNNFN
ncbi:sulfatase-like hydrolase/transferase [Planctomycetota bacterium]|nr:sulfatase-like hydrolase/transferase [Planctomycetota bacterium]